VRETLEQCAPAFFDDAWPGVAARIAADLRVKSDLRDSQGLGAALAATSDAVALAPEGDHIILDKLLDGSTSANGAGVTFIPSVFGHPHLVTVYARTTELALAWNLTPPEVSRHLAVLHRAGLVTSERRGRYVHYVADLEALTALGTDLLAAVLR